jgi:hypothetical protein
MLVSIGNTNPHNPNKLLIYDARNYYNAMANKMNKGGFENVTDHYTNCQIDFLDIDNIHGVRDAITKMYDIAKLYNTYNYQSRFLTQLDLTGWL